MGKQHHEKGSSKIRATGESPEEEFRNPVNAGIDEVSGSDHQKTLRSPTSTPVGMGIEHNEKYDSYWKGGK